MRRARGLYEEARGKGDAGAAFNLGVLYALRGAGRRGQGAGAL